MGWFGRSSKRKPRPDDDFDARQDLLDLQAEDLAYEDDPDYDEDVIR